MAKGKNYLKGRFETGDVPSQSDFEDLIDSAVNLAEDVDGTIPDSPEAGHVPTSGAVKSYVAAEVAKLPSKAEVALLSLKVGDFDEEEDGSIYEQIHGKPIEQVFELPSAFLTADYTSGSSNARTIKYEDGALKYHQSGSKTSINLLTQYAVSGINSSPIEEGSYYGIDLVNDKLYFKYAYNNQSDIPNVSILVRLYQSVGNTANYQMRIPIPKGQRNGVVYDFLSILKNAKPTDYTKYKVLTINGLVSDSVDAAISSNCDVSFYGLCKEDASKTDNIVDNVAKNKSDIESIRGSIIFLESSLPMVRKATNPHANLQKSQLRILHIGNSFMSNCTSYLGSMISAAGVDVSDMCIYTARRSSGSFKTAYDAYHGTETYELNRLIGGVTQPISTGDGSIPFQSAINDCVWDVIVIQQVSRYQNSFDEWAGNGLGGYLDELWRLLRTKQPMASIAINMTHAAGIYDDDSNNRFSELSIAHRKFASKYAPDIIIPYGTAVQNIRKSSINTTDNGFSHDNQHLAGGVGLYVAGAAYFESLIAPRYGVSILGNTYRANAPIEGTEYVSVTDTNAYVCQMAAVLAVNNMWEAVNPDNITL